MYIELISFGSFRQPPGIVILRINSRATFDRRQVYIDPPPLDYIFAYSENPEYDGSDAAPEFPRIVAFQKKICHFRDLN